MRNHPVSPAKKQQVGAAETVPGAMAEPASTALAREGGPHQLSRARACMARDARLDGTSRCSLAHLQHSLLQVLKGLAQLQACALPKFL